MGSPTAYVCLSVASTTSSSSERTQNELRSSSLSSASSITMSYPDGSSSSVLKVVLPDSPLTLSDNSGSSAELPSAITEIVLSVLPGALYMTPSSSPSVSNRRSSDRVWRSSTGVTSNV